MDYLSSIISEKLETLKIILTGLVIALRYSNRMREEMTEHSKERNVKNKTNTEAK